MHFDSYINIKHNIDYIKHLRNLFSINTSTRMCRLKIICKRSPYNLPIWTDAASGICLLLFRFKFALLDREFSICRYNETLFEFNEILPIYLTIL